MKGAHLFPRSRAFDYKHRSKLARLLSRSILNAFHQHMPFQLAMPSIQTSFFPLVEQWALLVTEVPTYPYISKNNPQNGIPIHLTISDFKNDLAPLTWVSHEYDKAWDQEWIGTTTYPLLRYIDEKTGRVCRYFGEDTLNEGSTGLTTGMWWAYLLLRRKGLVPDTGMLMSKYLTIRNNTLISLPFHLFAVIKKEQQAVFADPRSSYFTAKDRPQYVLLSLRFFWRAERLIFCLTLFCSLDNHVLDFHRKQVYEMRLPHYGVSMLAYTQSQDEGIKLWIAKRSSTKMSFPGLWDITVSGGIPAGLSVQEGLEKEAEEEAGMSKELLQNAR
jgi:hypothetical protein